MAASRDMQVLQHEAESGSIRGTWSPVWSMWEGISTSTDDLADVTLTVMKSWCEVRRGETLIRWGTCASDPTQSPRTLDVCFAESDVTELIGAALLGIYEVSEDRLRICYGPPGGKRAESFSSIPGSGQYLAEYERRPTIGQPGQKA